MARDSIRCSFCGKRQEQVNRIIAGPNVYICNECIDLCSSILRDEMKNGETQDLELPDTLPTPQEIKTSNLPKVFVASSGWRTTTFRVSRPK